MVPSGFEWKKLKNAFVGCCYALGYNNAFNLNPNEMLEVKVIWLAWPKVTSVVCQNLQRASPLKLHGQFELNLICSLQANGERKFSFV